MKWIILVFCLPIFSTLASAQAVYIDGDVQFTKMSGSEVEVLVKLDVGQYTAYYLRFINNTITLKQVPIADTATQKLFEEYQKKELTTKKLLECHPSIVNDLFVELISLKADLENRYVRSELWVDYQLIRHSVFDGIDYYFVRFQDGDRYYGGILYYIGTNSSSFVKIQLTSNPMDFIQSGELIDSEKFVVFRAVDNLTRIEVRWLPK